MRRDPGRASRPGLAAVRVVILTTFEVDKCVFDAIRADAAGFLVKDTGAAELLRAVRVVAGTTPWQAPACPPRRRRPAGRVPSRIRATAATGMQARMNSIDSCGNHQFSSKKYGWTAVVQVSMSSASPVCAPKMPDHR